MKVIISKSDKKGKKLKAVFTSSDGKKKTTHFGAKGYSDYTINKDKERRRLYRARHKKDLLTKDFTRAGFLSYYILWGDHTNLQDNIKDYKKRFNLD
jgi:hypothetical protein|tara:strand:- start:879 stop:1169 length:291 start_codon:yes stop_codon:yes gene_type:complete